MVGIKKYNAYAIMLGLTLVPVCELAPKTKKQAEKSSAQVREIKTVDEFNTLLKNNKQPKVLKFFSPTCPHCVTVKPVVEKVAKTHPNVLFVELSAKNKHVDTLFDTYNVQAYPTFVFIDTKGKIVQTHEGGYSKKALDDEVSSLEKRA